MNTQKYYLGLAIVIGILCIPALGEVELPPPEDKPILLGQPYPALTEIKLLCVVIASTSTEAGKDGLDTMILQTKIEGRLKEAGIEVFVPKKGVMYKLPPSSNLEVYLEIVNVADLHQCVFWVQTLLSQHVRLKEQSWNVRADVWKTKPVMQKVSVENMTSAVTIAVLEQVDEFIQAYKSANQSVAQPLSDINDVNVVFSQQSNLEIVKQAAEYKYVASKNGKVFHKSSCASARKIKPENLVGYNSVAEAEDAGKRPCKRCKP